MVLRAKPPACQLSYPSQNREGQGAQLSRDDGKIKRKPWVPGHSAESTSYGWSFCKCKLRGDPLSDFGLDDVPDQPPVSFHEGKPVRKAAFQQYADGIVAR